MARTRFPTRAANRPRKYETAHHMQVAIDHYFESCLDRTWVEKIHPVTREEYMEEKIEQLRPYTVTGLAVALGFETRESLLYYEHINPEFLSAITKAKLKCHCYAEESLYRKQQVAGVIFSLKNNYGWQDKMTNENIDVVSQKNNDEKARDARARLLAMANT